MVYLIILITALSSSYWSNVGEFDSPRACEEAARKMQLEKSTTKPQFVCVSKK